MIRLFLFGILQDDDLRSVVIPAARVVSKADWPGHSLKREDAGGSAVAVKDATGVVDGLLADLPGADLERLEFFASAFGQIRTEVEVVVDGESIAAETLVSQNPSPTSEPWKLMAWQARDAETTRRAARDVMGLMGTARPEDLARWMPSRRARIQAQTAARDFPAPVRDDTPTQGDVETSATKVAYDKFFRLEEVSLRHRTFSGAQIPSVDRAVFVMVDAVTVLPYDPVRDRVLLVDQFRAGPFVRGDAQPWLLEPVAGRVEGGQSWEETAQRELREEAGLDCVRLLKVGEFYPSPGAVTEYIVSYIGLVDLPEGSNGLHGLETEAEDIRTHLLEFDAAMEALEQGYIRNGPLFASILWLSTRRAELRASAGA